MNTTMTREPDLPAGFDAAVRAAAADLPPPRYDLTGVRARARAHRHRRIALRAGV